MKEKTLYNLQNYAFTLFIIISYFLYIISIIGLSKNAPRYIADLDGYVKIYICLFLIYRFNPFRSKIQFTELDRKIVFSAGIFILTTTTINNIILNYFDIIKAKLQNFSQFLSKKLKNNIK
jgi:hypothetical protein